MRTAEQLREALHKLDYQALSDSTKDGIKKIIENDNDEMHPAHSILIGIGSLRSQSSLAITESDLQDKAYQCIKILTQKYPPFLELVDGTGNTLSILYSTKDIAAKEVVLKLLLDPELNITEELLLFKKNKADPSLAQYSLAELILSDPDYIIQKINSLEVFERFKALGILPINSIDSNGKTILHHEFALSSFNVFKELVEMGAELLPDSEGQTPYDIAKETNQKEIVKFIEKRVSKNFANGALTNDKLSSQDALEIIAVHGFDTFIKATGMDPSEFLLKCSREKKGLSAGLLDLLVKHGADINKQDKYGQTPLHHAAIMGYIEVVELLIANGALVNAKDNGDKTPLHGVVIIGNTKVAKLLVANGADINKQDKYGQTPLHKSAELYSSTVAKLFIEKGADVNAKDMRDYTPLHTAARYGNTEVAKLLVANGADIYVKNVFNKTPHQLALENFQMKTAGLLRKAAAKDSAKTHAQKVNEERAASSSSSLDFFAF